MSDWIESAEAKLVDLGTSSSDRRPSSQERELSLEVERWRPKVTDLRSLSEKLVTLFVEAGGKDEKKEDVEKLGERWEDIVRQVEERLAGRRSFQMVEVEEIRTTISHLSITSPTPTTAATSTTSSTSTATAPAQANIVAATMAGEDLLDEEVIDTLPEEEEEVRAKRQRRINSHNNNGSNGKGASADVVGDEEDEDEDEQTVADSSLLSSRDSSPDLEVVTGTMILKSNSPTFIKETVSKIPKSKTPSNSLKRDAAVPAARPKRGHEEISQVVAVAPLAQPEKEPSSPVKTPPKTLPKPNWFSLQRDGEKSSSPERVKVSSDTLPGPAKAAAASAAASVALAAVGRPHDMESGDQRKCAVNHNEDKEDEDDAAFLAKENSAIERILNETTSELAEVKRKAGYRHHHMSSSSASGPDYHQKVVRDFEANVEAMLPKIDRARGKLDELDGEQDLRLRRDLISMESKMMEAEVATLISRGDTLVLFTHRGDPRKAERLQGRVAALREAWAGLRRLAEEKRAEAARAEESAAEFQRRLEDLVAWVGDAHERCSSSSTAATSTTNSSSSDGGGEAMRKEREEELAREVEAKASEVRAINELAAEVKRRQGTLGANSMVLTVANAQWEKLLGRVRARREAEALARAEEEGGGGGESSSGAGAGVAPADAGEVLARISKMREAVEAVDRQLRTQVLSGPGKRYENLPEQARALDTCRDALETLRPTIKRTAKDLEALTGSLSVEYLEKIVALSERLRDEWQRINRRFSERHAAWVESKERHDSYHRKRRELENWLERAEGVLLQSSTAPPPPQQPQLAGEGVQSSSSASNRCSQEHLQLERQVSEKNKEVTGLAVLGKDIMNQTSAQEHVEIQAQVDRVLKRWKFVLSQLAAHRERMNREKYVNNVNYMNHWLEENLARVLAPVNPTDAAALAAAIKSIRWGTLLFSFCGKRILE